MRSSFGSMNSTFTRAAIGFGPVFASFALALAAPAAADVTVGPGAFYDSGQTTFGGILSGGIQLPASPIHLDAVIASPLNNGGYAGTFEVRATPAQFEFGAGAGVGSVGTSNPKVNGAIFSAFIGHNVTRNTVLEARTYFGGSRTGTFMGDFRFTL